MTWRQFHHWKLFIFGLRGYRFNNEGFDDIFNEVSHTDDCHTIFNRLKKDDGEFAYAIDIVYKPNNGGYYESVHDLVKEIFWATEHLMNDP